MYVMSWAAAPPAGHFDRQTCRETRQGLSLVAMMLCRGLGVIPCEARRQLSAAAHSHGGNRDGA